MEKSSLIGDVVLELRAAKEKIKKLEAELEVERIRLAACGIAALDPKQITPDMCPEYNSASLQDVLRVRKRLDEALEEVAFYSK